MGISVTAHAPPTFWNFVDEDCDKRQRCLRQPFDIDNDVRDSFDDGAALIWRVNALRNVELSQGHGTILDLRE